MQSSVVPGHLKKASPARTAEQRPWDTRVRAHRSRAIRVEPMWWALAWVVRNSVNPHAAGAEGARKWPEMRSEGTYNFL